MHTSLEAAETWFESLICSHGEGDSQTVQPNLGVLAKVETNSDAPLFPSRSAATEVVFFAATPSDTQCPPTPPRSSDGGDKVHQSCPEVPDQRCGLKAMLLCSDLLQSRSTAGLTPPPSPGTPISDRLKVVYLPDRPTTHQPTKPPRKRKTIDQTFDEAIKRRRQTKETQADDIPKAPTHPQLNAQPVQPRPNDAAQSGKTASTRALEQKNKDLISRLVLTGMRMHGLSQPKSRPSTSAEGSTSAPAAITGSEAERSETFKLTYHNTLKALLFAFRAHTATRNLAEHMDVLRENVDQLLGMFCSDPLAEAELVAAEEAAVTGGSIAGRTPFRTPVARDEILSGGFPFPSSAERRGSVAGGKGQEKEEAVFMTPVQRRSGVDTFT